MTPSSLHGSVAPESVSRALDMQRLARTLWIVSALAVYYGTLIPFEFHRDAAQALENAQVALALKAPDSAGKWFSAPDIVQNVMLFLPFGFFAWLASARLVVVLICAALLSFSAECLQLWTPHRVSSWIDLTTNSIGAFLGYVVAPIVVRRGGRLHGFALSRGWSDSRQSRVALILLALAIIHHLHPFAFGLDVGMVWRKLKGLPETFFFFPDKGDGLTVLHWVLASSLVSAVLRPAVSARRCALLLCLVALGAELCQFIIRARVPGFHDMLVASLSIAFGTWLSTRLPALAPAGDGVARRYATADIPLLTLALFLLTIAWDTLHPFHLEAFHGFTWLPFAEQYNRTTFGSLSDAMELLFAGLAISLVFACYAPGKAARVVAAFLAMFGFALLETSQAWIVGRYAGTGDMLALAMGMWLGFRLAPGLLELHPGKPGLPDPS